MAATNGFIIKLSDIKEGHTSAGHHNLIAFPFMKPGEEGSLHTGITLDFIEPGGSIDSHYHTDCDVFDHIFYVISGQIQVKLGDKEEIAGPDTVIYCPSNVAHSIKNVGKEQSKVLRIGAAANGDIVGKPVHL
ncbi:cupin domain-containing protein [Chloroflexota bacterium]